MMTDKQRFLRRKNIKDNLEFYLDKMRYYRLHEENALRPGFVIWRWQEEKASYVIHEIEEEV